MIVARRAPRPGRKREHGWHLRTLVAASDRASWGSLDSEYALHSGPIGNVHAVGRLRNEAQLLGASHGLLPSDHDRLITSAAA